MFDEVVLKIRRRETPFYERLYGVAKLLRGFEIPVVPVLHSFLWQLHLLVRTFFRMILRIFYNTPLFKTQCARVGKGLYISGGIPLVMGHLRLELGDWVTMHAKCTLVGAKVFERPTLKVGNNTHLGYLLIISVGCDVTIGDNVLIGDRVSILSYDGHPTNPAERHLPAPKSSSRSIYIEDNVWICSNCTILKGVSIGKGSIIANGSVVTSNVPSNSLAVGNPARCSPLKI